MLDVLLELGRWTVRRDHIVLYLVDVAWYLFAVPDLVVVHGHLRLILLESTIWNLVTIFDLVRGWAWKPQLPRGQDFICLSNSLGS